MKALWPGRRPAIYYHIRHITEYRYSQPASLSHNQARLSPRSTPSQQCLEHSLRVNPAPSSLIHRTDYFGNSVADFFIQTQHSRFEVISQSSVHVDLEELPSPSATPAWEHVVAGLNAPSSDEELDANQYVYPSSLVPWHSLLRAYALESFAPGRPILQAAIALTSRIFREFKYDKTATIISTPVLEVFEMRRGVCQDFAHLMIACLRSLGLSARYVSGYLRTLPPPGKPRIVGADASHAWLSVFVPPNRWIDLDPTNNQPATWDYITLAWGRDYHDIAPLRGVFLGGGAHALRVSVDVAPIEPSAI